MHMRPPLLLCLGVGVALGKPRLGRQLSTLETGSTNPLADDPTGTTAHGDDDYSLSDAISTDMRAESSRPDDRTNDRLARLESAQNELEQMAASLADDLASHGSRALDHLSASASLERRAANWVDLPEQVTPSRRARGRLCCLQPRHHCSAESHIPVIPSLFLL